MDANTYDHYADEYADLVAGRSPDRDPVVPRLLEAIGPVSGLSVLDAGCGEGFFSRIMSEQEAHVTGVDISPRLIALARLRNPDNPIAYRVADLSKPLPDLAQHFDLAVSHLVLNDVPDHAGFFLTVASLVRPGGRLVLSMNNPYSYVVRSHVKDYFDSGKPFLYRGMAEEGVRVYFYQRTLEEYLDAAFTAGWQLRRLIDVPTPEGTFKRRDDTLLPVGYQFPFFMILDMVKTDVRLMEQQ